MSVQMQTCQYVDIKSLMDFEAKGMQKHVLNKKNLKYLVFTCSNKCII